VLQSAENKNAAFQTMEILKARGIKTSKRVISYRITPDGFEVKPQEAQ
jgi:hypothetical protein